MLGRDIFLQTLRDYGVKYLFGNPGTTELPIMDGLPNYPEIEYILALHEDIAVGMAAGFAQASGLPAVVNLHVTPGLAHGLGNIYDAYKAGIPLIVTAGQHDSSLAIQEPALAGDMLSMVKPFTKWCWEVHKGEELAVALQRAFKVANTHPQGPVFISLPSDVMLQEVAAAPLPLSVIRQNAAASAEDLQQVAQMLLHADKPMMLVGDQVGRSEAIPEIITLAETIAAEVLGEHQSSGLNFPYTHPQFVGRCLPNGPFIQNNFADADVIVLIGVSSQAPLLYFSEPLFNKKSRLIQLDCNPWELAKNSYVDIAILADIKPSLCELNRLLETQVNASGSGSKIIERRQKIHAKKQQIAAALSEDLEQTWNQVPLSPSRLMHELNKFLNEKTFVVDESVTSGRYVHGYLDLNRANSLISLKGGGLGYGMPAALGAQLARQDERVVAIIGDGAALYYIQALWNAARYKLPVIYIIVNNTSYMILKGGLQRMNGPAAANGVYPGMDITNPAVDLVTCANSFGVEALQIKNPKDIAPALEHAFSVERPILLDCVIDRTVKVYLQ